MQIASLKIKAIEVGDFQFAARGGLEIRSNLDYRSVVEIDAGDGELRLGLLRLFLNADSAAVRAELYDAIALRVLDLVGEDGGSGGVRRSTRTARLDRYA